jgi:CrcB protein
MWRSIVAICIGGSLGCVLRWFLALWFNGPPSIVPLGTLAANLIGGYIIGVAVAFFALNNNVAPEWKVLIITGFCGGLTTFSSFSAEVVTLLRNGRMLWACSTIGLHLCGSLLATFLGFATIARFKSGS